MVAAGIAIMAISLFPSPAFAWTPGTHVFLGEAVLRSLAMLPANIAELLAAFPYDFLYGSIAADTSIALARGSIRQVLDWLDEHGNE